MLALLIGRTLLGCIAIKPTVALVTTRQALKEAELAGAEERAPYEYTMAAEYQQKAREEWGGSDFEECDSLTATAYQYALQAEEIARYGASDVDLERLEIMDQLDGDLNELEDAQ